MYLATTPEANELLETDPFALLIGMLLDQQIPIEKAFTSPAVLKERMTPPFDAQHIAHYGPAEFEEIFRTPPALHRFPAAMAKRVQALARVLVDRYDGDAAAIWRDAEDGKDVVARLGSLPGFGEQKSKIFAALLAKQFGVQPAGWREASGDYGAAGSHKSVADVVDASSLAKVRAYKQELKSAARAKS
jgi:uncharacterized HhH-GPD family protein